MREYIDHSKPESRWPPAADTMKTLKMLYLFRDEKAVASFLEKHSFLTPLLLQAHEKIEEYFGPSNVALEVSIDPDDASYEELWALIQTNLRAAEAVGLLTKFDEEWWLDASVSSQELMNFNLEFI